MKLFPTNLFSSGQDRTSSSQSRSKDNHAFASLMRDESPDLSRQVSNDTSMGRTEEAREVNSRPDQAATKSRRKAEDRDSQTASDVRSARDADTQEPVRQQSTDPSDTPSDDGAAAEQHQPPAEISGAASEPTRQAPSDLGSAKPDTAAPSLVVETLSEEAIPLPILQAAVQAPVDGKPVPETNPLVGATLLSPAALGGIEGLEIASNSISLDNPGDVPVLGESLIRVEQILTQKSGAEGMPLSPTMTELLPQTTAPNPLLQAAQAVPEQTIRPQASTGSELGASSKFNPNMAVSETPSSAAQTGQAMLGGSVFQELIQQGQGPQELPLNRGEKPALFSKSDGEGVTLQELPEAFQEAKSIWTRVDARPTTLQQTTETLSDIPADEGVDSSDADVEVLPSSAKNTRPLAGQPTRSTQVSSSMPTSATPTVAEVAQEQTLESRIEFRTTAQNVMMRDVAPTPEGHVPALTEVMVEIDEELRVGVRTNGSEVAVALDGTTRAVEEMRHIGPELQESLENLGFTLSEFSTNDEDAEFDVEGQPESSKKDSDSHDSTRSAAPRGRTVRHGMRVDTTA